MKQRIHRILCFLLLLCVLAQMVGCETNPAGSGTQQTDASFSSTSFADVPTYEVYVGVMAKDFYQCFILPGTHRAKTFGELLSASLSQRTMTVDEARKALETYKVKDSEIVLHPYVISYSSYLGTPEECSEETIAALFDNRYRCETAGQGILAEAPQDFSFAVQWGVNGTHSYDSSTHNLVKARDAEDVSRYSDELILESTDISEIYTLLTDCIDFYAYPADFDPLNAPDAKMKVKTTPSDDIKITLRENGKTHEVAFSIGPHPSEDRFWCEEAIRLYEVYLTITDILTSSEVWKALPESPLQYQ